MRLRPLNKTDIKPDIKPDAAETQPHLELVDNFVPRYDEIKVTLVNTPLKAETLIRRLAQAPGYIGLDTEAVGPQLRGRDFINISHASLLGFSVALQGHKDWTYYMPVRHAGNNLGYEYIHQIFSLLAGHAKRGKVVAHNAKFDWQVLKREGFEVDLVDSMVAAWLCLRRNHHLGLKDLAAEILLRKSPPYDPGIAWKTGDQAKQYAGHDARNTLDLMLHFLPDLDLEWFDRECQFARVLGHMKLAGVVLDFEKLQILNAELQAEKEKILETWRTYFPHADIGSSKQLQQLFEDGTWVPRGVTKSGQHATGSDVMKWNLRNTPSHDGRGAAWMRLAYQEIDKIAGTYTTGLIEEALQWADHRLHADLWHFGTGTGRLSCSNPNLQNQPAHGGYAKSVREAYVAKPGWRVTGSDFSQIELRYFADYCGGALADAYKLGHDVHQMTADAMDISRSAGKMVNFGFLLYGGGPDKLARELGCSREEAERKIEDLDARYPEVQEWRQNVIRTVGGEVEWVRGQPTVVGGRDNYEAKTLAGRWRNFPELNPTRLRKDDPERYNELAKKYAYKCRVAGKQPTAAGEWMSIRAAGERYLINYLIQGGARDLLVIAMTEFYKCKDPEWEISMTVHDEVILHHPAEDSERVRELLKRCMEESGKALGVQVPIEAEPVTGRNWAEIK